MRKKRSAYDAIAAARRYMSAGLVTIKQFHQLTGISERTLQSMLSDGYENQTLESVDLIADAVRALRMEHGPR